LRKAYGSTSAMMVSNGSQYGFGHYLVPSELEMNVILDARVWGSSSAFDNQISSGDYVATAQCTPSSQFVNTSNNELPGGYWITSGCKDTNTRTERRDSGFDPKSKHTVKYKNSAGNWVTLITNQTLN
jgi:hypothetical protein